MKKPTSTVSFNPVDEGFYEGNLAVDASCRINKLAGLNHGGLEMASQRDAIKVEESAAYKFTEYENRNDSAFAPDKTMTDPVGLIRLLFRALRVMHNGYALRKAVNMIPWDNAPSLYPLVDEITMENKREMKMTFKDVTLDVNPDDTITMNVETGEYDLLDPTTNLITKIIDGSVAIGEIINRQIWASMLRECDNIITISKSSIDQDLAARITKRMGDGARPNAIVMHPLTSSMFEKSPFLTRGHFMAFTDMYVPTGIAYLFEQEKMTVGDGLFVMNAYENKIQMIKYINPNILDTVRKQDCLKIEIK